jgi:hypothetical protein
LDEALNAVAVDDDDDDDDDDDAELSSGSAVERIATGATEASAETMASGTISRGSCPVGSDLTGVKKLSWASSLWSEEDGLGRLVADLLEAVIGGADLFPLLVFPFLSAIVVVAEESFVDTASSSIAKKKKGGV